MHGRWQGLKHTRSQCGLKQAGIHPGCDDGVRDEPDVVPSLLWHDGCISYAIHLPEDLLDFGRIDAIAANFYLTVSAANDLQQSIRADMYEIAGTKDHAVLVCGIP